MSTVKDVYIRLLSRSVPVFVPATKRALTTHLSRLESGISEQSYKSWVVETFIVGINDVYSAILELSTEVKKKRAKESLYKAVLKHNPLLDPLEISIDGGGLTFTHTGHSVVDSSHWKVNTDDSSIPLITDFHKYFELSRSAREHDHSIETEYSDVLDMGVKVRVFPKKFKNDLLFGLDPKTRQQLRFYIINICIDSFHDIYRLLQDSNEVPLKSMLDALYEMSVEQNPFLHVTVAQVKRINKTVSTHRQAQGGSELEVTTKGRKALKDVPRTDVMNLEKNMLSKIFGQDNAVKAVADAYKRAISGIKNPNTPIGAFLFYGETSTGKTELARIVAELLTKNPKGLLRISCNTLQSSHSISTLVGSPPGYVGSEEDGCFASGLEDSNFKVVLFDEVDKAHKNIYDLVLEMLEDGKIMVANGEVLDFSECLVIFTSNMGQHEGLAASNAAGFSANLTDKSEVKKQVAKKTLENKLTPEFRARLTGEFYFKSLSEEDLVKTAGKYLEERAQQLKKNKITFHYPNPLPQALLMKCQEMEPKTLHPRYLNNFIEQEVFKNLGDFLITQNLIGNKKALVINLKADGEFEHIIETNSKKVTNKSTSKKKGATL